METFVWMIWAWLMLRTWCQRKPRIVYRTSLVMRGSLDHREWLLIPTDQFQKDEFPCP